MLGETEEGVGLAVAGVELVVVDLPGEHHLVHPELTHQLLEPVEVALEATGVSHQEEPALRLYPALVGGERPDQVLDLLVGDHTPHEEDVRALVVMESSHHGRRGAVVLRQVEDDGENAGPLEAGRLQLLPVVLAVAQAQRGAGGEGLELSAAMVAQPRQVGVEAEEEGGRGDVVVDDHEGVGQVEGQAARGAPDGEVEEAHRLRGGLALVLPQGTGQVGHPGVHLLGEDVRGVARRPEVGLDGQGLVADGVAVGEGGQELVHPARPVGPGAAHSRSRSASSPPRSPATISSRVFARRWSISTRPVSWRLRFLSSCISRLRRDSSRTRL